MINHSLVDNYTFVMLLSLKLLKRQGRSYKREEKSLQKRQEASNSSCKFYSSRYEIFLSLSTHLKSLVYHNVFSLEGCGHSCTNNPLYTVPLKLHSCARVDCDKEVRHSPYDNQDDLLWTSLVLCSFNCIAIFYHLQS